MAIETERKFLVIGETWRSPKPKLIRQGYLNLEPERTVRVRTKGDQAWLTIKGLTVGASRPEFEYEIPVGDAESLLKLCVGPNLEKERHEVLFGGKMWEVDEFLGDNAGLVVAELELDDADEEFDLPDWIGREVTDDPRYYNSNLSTMPYRLWTEG